MALGGLGPPSAIGVLAPWAHTGCARLTRMASRSDVIIVGGGIAGASAAYHLSAAGRHVTLLEQESELAFHSTSRSAAIYVEVEGGRLAGRLSVASRSFLENPPLALDAPLLERLGYFVVAPAHRRDEMLDEIEVGRETTPSLEFLEGSAVTDLCPVLVPERAAVGRYEPHAMSVDVMALHQLYVRGARDVGASIERSARVGTLSHGNHGWIAQTQAGTFTAPVVVNAAGAWGDVVGVMAGARPIGLVPRRRTAFTTGIDLDPTPWPFVANYEPGEQCYFKPEAGSQLLCSLADETASEPTDARPAELDIALAIEHLNALTTLDIRSVRTTWAGLRTFAPDRDQVLGWDDRVEGFCWMVGQGGVGITTSPAAGAVVASVVANEALPGNLAALGLSSTMLGPRRVERRRSV